MRRGAALKEVLAPAGLLLLTLLPAAPAGAQQQQAGEAGDPHGRTLTRETRDPEPVTDAMLRNPDAGDWLMSHRTYDFQAFSPLDEINRDNVHRLQLAWMRAMDEGPLQIRPLVYDGVMYVEHPGDDDHLQAWDATTGDLLWDYLRQAPDDLREYTRFGDRTRNLAIYGTNIYHLTGDAQVLAVDAGSGEFRWLSEAADYREGISNSSGAMIINGQVLSGRTCDPGSLIARCYIAAHDPETGDERWRFYTAAGADDPGGQTWGDLPVARRVHTSAWGCRAATTLSWTCFSGALPCRCPIRASCAAATGTSATARRASCTRTRPWRCAPVPARWSGTTSTCPATTGTRTSCRSAR